MPFCSSFSIQHSYFPPFCLRPTIFRGGEGMNRTEIEIKLNQDRAWLLETFAAMSEEDLNRGITTSRQNVESRWSAKDHLTHLIGIEVAFNSIIKRYVEGHPNPIGIAVNEDGTRRS